MAKEGAIRAAAGRCSRRTRLARTATRSDDDWKRRNVSKGSEGKERKEKGESLAQNIFQILFVSEAQKTDALTVTVRHNLNKEKANKRVSERASRRV